ncbi:MAG: hypothetical protein ACP5OG_02430 [Candidatus Nanoarchaeia archaeon]
MKKRELFLALVVAVFLLSFLIIFSENVFGSSSDQATVVFNSGENIWIYLTSPEQKEYEFNTTSNFTIGLNASSNFPLTDWKYTLINSDSDDVIYNNLSFTPNTTFDAIEGTNYLIVFAKDVNGIYHNKSVIFTVDGLNFAPILNISKNIYACEKDYAASYFYASDANGDFLTVDMTPKNPFYINVVWQEYGNLTGVLFSGILNKAHAGGVNAGYKIYQENIFVSDTEAIDSQNINVTVMEINNAPQIGQVGVQTVWYRGEGRNFYKNLSVYDTEDGYLYDNKVNVSLQFVNHTNLFNISSLGIMNYTANESDIGVYTVQVCAKDRGIASPHPNISICGQNGSSIRTCQNFSLTVTDLNRVPTIVSYYPLSQSLNVNGMANTMFNISKYDPDYTIPDSYWYVDGVLTDYLTGESNDEFFYEFGCNVSGVHNISALITDGAAFDSFNWSVNVNDVACPVSDDGRQGGGGGSGKGCTRKWACLDWSECKDLKKSFENGKIFGENYRFVLNACSNKFGYKDNCGYQERNCSDLNQCNNTLGKPNEVQMCFYTYNPNCNDKIKNCHSGACEILADCGGPCSACPTCSDGIKNQNEEAVDCGGPCSPCQMPEPVIKKVGSGIFYLASKFYIILFIIIFVLLLILIIARLKKIWILFIIKKKKEEEEKKNLSEIRKKRIDFGFFFFVFLLIFCIGAVFSYPILDSGISDSFNEDAFPVYEYNFTRNITGAISGALEFSIYSINSTLPNMSSVSDYYWIWINSSTGILTINSTMDNQTGIFNISINTIDSSDQGTTVASMFNVSPVNDAPVFMGLENQSLNITYQFLYIINVTDEENNVPFVLDINFTSCFVAEWSTRNCSNYSDRELFNSSYYTFDSELGILNISFTPSKNDVGNYIINFSVMDNSSRGNKTTSKIINFSVINTNSPPYFRYICDNGRNFTEDQEAICYINASDIDEIQNLTITANYSWFTFNETFTNIVTKNVSSLTEFNMSAFVNFTPRDSQVGNWWINFSIVDIGYGGYASRMNSTVIYFYINNTEDSVSLDEVNNQTIYENKTIYVNATDNDLLVQDKSVKNEVLTFASNTSWVSISTYSIADNITIARIDIDYSSAMLIGEGNYTVNINVTDTAGNFVERDFTINVLGDHAATWNQSMQTEFLFYEDDLISMNFSQNVSDIDGDSLTFSFTSSSSFSGFAIDSSTGVINFNPSDLDVGYHNVTINASDGKLDSLKSFNFTIFNINDNVSIETPLSAENASVDSNSNINATEDNQTMITLWVKDDDFIIPEGQKSFYNESLSISVNITGPNTTLFSFSKTSNFPTAFFPNRTEYIALFNPGKADIGEYNIIINVTDLSGNSTFISFNLSISAVSHPPVLMNLTNQTSSINRTFYYRINASDLEDGYSYTLGNNNFTFSYKFLEGVEIFNSSIFNSTTGEINITFNLSQFGRYKIEVNVSDSEGLNDSGIFFIHVYSYPNITFPLVGTVFNASEGNASNLVFRANHSIEANLSYYVLIDNLTRYNSSFFGNNSDFNWTFVSNYSDEGMHNITILVVNEQYNWINSSKTYLMNISHANQPVNFSSYIGDKEASYTSSITINLSNYFYDIDAFDTRYNQTINFTLESNETNSTISYTISGFMINLTSNATTSEILTIHASDLEGNDSVTNASSNSFSVTFIEPTPGASSIVSSSSSSSGGGSSRMQSVAIKLVLPDPISSLGKEKIVVNIGVINEGKLRIENINLRGVIARDGVFDPNISLSFSEPFIKTLEAGQRKNVSLTINVGSNKKARYEITINGTSLNPPISDWGKFYIDIIETNSTALEKIIFTEELLAQNPECIELKELLVDVRKYYEEKQYDKAVELSKSIVDSCKASIAQKALPRLGSLKGFFFYSYILYFVFGFVAAIVILMFYYIYRRERIKRAYIR